MEEKRNVKGIYVERDDVKNTSEGINWRAKGSEGKKTFLDDVKKKEQKMIKKGEKYMINSVEFGVSNDPDYDFDEYDIMD